MAAMTLRLPDDLHEDLRKTAEHSGRSMQSVAAEAIRQYVNARQQRRDDAVDRLLVENAATLAELA